MTKIAASKGDIKSSWRMNKEIIDKKSKSTDIHCIKNFGQEITINSKIENVMNDRFCNKSTDFTRNIAETANPLLSGNLNEKLDFKI